MRISDWSSDVCSSDLLSTSKSRLASVWEEQRRILPDTDHPGLLAIVERRITEDEDLILLLSAVVSQFRSADAIVEEAEQAAHRAGLEGFDREAAIARLALPGASCMLSWKAGSRALRAAAW